MKKWIVLSLIGVLSIITINIYNNSLEENIYITNDIIKGNKIGVYLEQDNGAYIYSEKIPDKGTGYTLDTTSSVCDGDTTISWDSKNWEVELTNITKKDLKCYLYFKKLTESEQTLDKFNLTVNTTDEGCPAIGEDGLPTEELTNEISEVAYLCEGVDNDGKTYYFRGGKNSVNNWVKMGSSYWRIIRINGDGTIRLIYNGTSVEDTGIAESSVAYNTTRTDNKYVGFMYGDASNNYADATTNTNKSNILTRLNAWYEGNSFPAQYKDLLDENAGFCNDRTPYASTTDGSPDTSGHGFGSSGTTYYGAYIRITNKKPTFKCPQDNDLFTKNGSEKGNKALTNPIGLITADEVMYAGAVYSTSNTYYWLHNGSYYWTMSPYSFGNGNAFVFRVNSDGSLNNMNGTWGIRPVINLKANTPFTETGDGSADNPFEVSLTP